MRLPTFPLLVKELSELAARRRTYLLRSAYAVVLLFLFFAMHQSLVRSNRSSIMGLIGVGGGLFDDLFTVEYWAVLLLMPALTAGALTGEKEQGSLTILMLTDLGPWELLMQKWWSRLIAVGSFLLLGMPLMGLCYAYGGLEVDRLLLGIFILLLLCLQTAAVALAVSAWCRGSIAALLATYAILAVLYLGPALGISIWRVLTAGHGGPGTMGLSVIDLLWPLRLQPSIYVTTPSWPTVLMRSLPAAGSVLAALLFARWALPRRAQPSGSGFVLAALRRLDGWFERGDRALGRRGGARDLPLAAPVAWRELNRRSLANWRYLMRFLVVGLGITVLLLSLVAAYDATWDAFNTTLQITSLAMLGVVLVLALVLGSTVIATERTQQTLEVLLTTPLSARTILVEKLRGLRRISLAIVLPALLLAVWNHVDHLDMGFRSNHEERGPLHLAARFAYYLLLPPLFSWFAIAIGLMVQRANRAMILALIGGCLWVGSTMVIALILFSLCEVRETSPAMLLTYFTPGMLPIYTETGERADRAFGGLPLMLGVFVAWHGALWLLLRWWCLRHADRLMRRGGGT